MCELLDTFFRFFALTWFTKTNKCSALAGVTDLVGNPRDSETGVYRDCGIIPDYMGDYCQWFTEELGLFNIKVESCESCNTSLCNNHVFNEIDGSIIVTEDSGSYTITLSLILLIFGITMTKFL